jgi:hypothetical protein
LFGDHCRFAFIQPCQVHKIRDVIAYLQGSDHWLRWVASALLFVESRWNKLHGPRHLPVLNNAPDAAYRVRTGKAAAASAA